MLLSASQSRGSSRLRVRIARRTQIWRSQALRFDGSRSGVPRPPGQFHRFLDGVLGLLGVPQDGIGNGEKPAALRLDSGFKPWRNTRRLIVSHDHETVEAA